jgi:hypothetical protein
MRKLFSRHRPSPTMIVALVALMVAMGGTGYAAVRLPKNSVGSKQIKKNAVTSAKVKNASLQASDLAAGQLPAGAQGDPGPPGPTSTPAYARVLADGSLQPNVAGFPPQNQGTILVSKGEAGAATGTYCFDLTFRPASAMVALDSIEAGPADRDLVTSVAIDRGEDLGDCPANRNDARVRVVDGNTGAAQDSRFFIWFKQ